MAVNGPSIEDASVTTPTTSTPPLAAVVTAPACLAVFVATVGLVMCFWWKRRRTATPELATVGKRVEEGLGAVSVKVVAEESSKPETVKFQKNEEIELPTLRIKTDDEIPQVTPTFSSTASTLLNPGDTMTNLYPAAPIPTAQRRRPLSASDAMHELAQPSDQDILHLEEFMLPSTGPRGSGKEPHKSQSMTDIATLASSTDNHTFFYSAEAAKAAKAAAATGLDVGWSTLGRSMDDEENRKSPEGSVATAWGEALAAGECDCCCCLGICEEAIAAAADDNATIHSETTGEWLPLKEDTPRRTAPPAGADAVSVRTDGVAAQVADLIYSAGKAKRANRVLAGDVAVSRIQVGYAVAGGAPGPQSASVASPKATWDHRTEDLHSVASPVTSTGSILYRIDSIKSYASSAKTLDLHPQPSQHTTSPNKKFTAEAPISLMKSTAPFPFPTQAAIPPATSEMLDLAGETLHDSYRERTTQQRPNLQTLFQQPLPPPPAAAATQSSAAPHVVPTSTLRRTDTVASTDSTSFAHPPPPQRRGTTHAPAVTGSLPRRPGVLRSPASSGTLAPSLRTKSSVGTHLGSLARPRPASPPHHAPRHHHRHAHRGAPVRRDTYSTVASVPWSVGGATASSVASESLSRYLSRRETVRTVASVEEEVVVIVEEEERVDEVAAAAEADEAGRDALASLPLDVRASPSEENDASRDPAKEASASETAEVTAA
ncbi:hypothetical protein HDU96_007979 [Phlyctochytrium bullatum]|nr:hypothetical protein HDU96_007979 [Phlyctochytrium bullatum]